jgi:hypothetical protein
MRQAVSISVEFEQFLDDNALRVTVTTLARLLMAKQITMATIKVNGELALLLETSKMVSWL